MYDNLESPGRNDECWCGSGKKYKKCHLEFDRHLQELHDAGEIVLGRDWLKTPEEIEGIKAPRASTSDALDYVAEHIGAGRAPRKSTAGFTTTASSMGRFPPTSITRGFPRACAPR